MRDVWEQCLFWWFLLPRAPATASAESLQEGCGEGRSSLEWKMEKEAVSSAADLLWTLDGVKGHAQHKTESSCLYPSTCKRKSVISVSFGAEAVLFHACAEHRYQSVTQHLCSTEHMPSANFSSLLWHETVVKHGSLQSWTLQNQMMSLAMSEEAAASGILCCPRGNFRWVFSFSSSEPGISSDSTTLKHVVSVLGLGVFINSNLNAKEPLERIHTSPLADILTWALFTNWRNFLFMQKILQVTMWIKNFSSWVMRS